MRATKLPARGSNENVKVLKPSQFCFILDDLYLTGLIMCNSQCSQKQTTDKDATTGNRKHHRNHLVPHLYLCIYCTMLKPQNEHKYANSVPLQLHCLSALQADKSIYRPFLQSNNSHIVFSSLFCLFFSWCGVSSRSQSIGKGITQRHLFSKLTALEHSLGHCSCVDRLVLSFLALHQTAELRRVQCQTN